MKTIVLAAGKSTRIAAVSGGLPKPLLPVRGEAILARNLRWLASQGVRQVWINLHYQPDTIREAIKSEAVHGVRITYVEQPELIGTAGGARDIARDLAGEWNETTLIVYGDNLISTDLAALTEDHRRHRAVVTMALFDRRVHPHTGIAGGRVRIDSENRIVEFVEGAGDELSPLVNAGVYLIEPSVMALIPPGQFFDFAKDLFPILLARHEPIYGHLISGYCLGIDTPESYRRAMELIETGKLANFE